MNEYDSGSFRDRRARVFYYGGEIYRGLDETAHRDWRSLVETRFFPNAVAKGQIVATEEVPRDSFDAPDSPSGEPWHTILHHARVPFISYPYEWPFGMLRDAALLQLQLLEASIAEDFILKDSSSYNVQWFGSRPTFIDVASFETLQKGAPWVGYRQFCQLFLYPLMLQAYRGAPFQPWLRGCIDGPRPQDAWAFFSCRDLARPGVFAHVYLQAKLQARFAATTKTVSNELKDSGFGKELILANVRKLKKIVTGLAWQPAQSEWSDYEDHHSYSDEDHRAKKGLVADICKAQEPKLVWDIGCNTGTFSRIAAEHGAYVVAMDADTLAVQKLYDRLRQEQRENILPLTMNLADPSPNLGWRGQERKSMENRRSPDLLLCLALIHHAVITAHIPLRDFVGWIASLGCTVVLEFVTREDPMVRTLLRNKADTYADYTLENFERVLSESFAVKRRTVTNGGTRVLFLGEPSGSA